MTGEVTDLEAGLRNLRSVEAQYLTLLTNAKEISDILQVQDRLTETRGQIERSEGRLALLESLADLSTLSVDLQQTAQAPDGDGGGGPLDAAGEAWDASLATLNVIATAAVVVVVYSWWLLPIVIIGALALWRWAPRRRRAARRDSDVE